MLKLLQIGYDGPITVRCVDLSQQYHLGLRLIYLSDFHFNGFCHKKAKTLAQIVVDLKPDITILGGDYVDTRGGFAPFQYFLASIRSCGKVLAIAGNHDVLWGKKHFEDLMTENGIAWIEQQALTLSFAAKTIRISGNLWGKQPPKVDFKLLCLHKPMTLPKTHNPYHLVLAGHLHGSQLVFWENENGLYPGRWFYRWNIPETQVDHCRYIIGRGLGDTLPLRYNCPFEVILIKL